MTNANDHADAATTPSQRLRARLLAAMDGPVAAHGWTSTALRAAGEEAGLSAGEVSLAAPNGIDDILDAFADRADQMMLAAVADMDLLSMRVRERVTAGVRARIMAQQPHRAMVQAAGRALIDPRRSATAARLSWRTADRIWRALGDTSTDANFYSKRAILTGVLGATYARWVTDTSPDDATTWAFLDARINNVMAFEKAKAQFKPLEGVGLAALQSLARMRYGRG